jgi:hypothetical protein
MMLRSYINPMINTRFLPVWCIQTSTLLGAWAGDIGTDNAKDADDPTMRWLSMLSLKEVL